MKESVVIVNNPSICEAEGRSGGGSRSSVAYGEISYRQERTRTANLEVGGKGT